jgi:hypothetical protein
MELHMATNVQFDVSEPQIHTVSKPAGETDLDRDFSLEIAELEIVLETKCDTELSFEASLRSALGATGNSYLFPFPASSFHKRAEQVAAIRIDAIDEATVAYAYEVSVDGKREFRLATADELPEELLAFAANYAALIVTLRSIVPAKNSELMH